MAASRPMRLVATSTTVALLSLLSVTDRLTAKETGANGGGGWGGSSGDGGGPVGGVWMGESGGGGCHGDGGRSGGCTKSDLPETPTAIPADIPAITSMAKKTPFMSDVLFLTQLLAYTNRGASGISLVAPSSALPAPSKTIFTSTLAVFNSWTSALTVAGTSPLVVDRASFAMVDWCHAKSC